MKIKTKILAALLSLTAFAVMTTSCAKATPTPVDSTPISTASEATIDYADRTLVKIATLKGPTGMGMVQLFDENEKKSTLNRYETLIVGAPDEIVGKITTGEVDIAAVPVNLASVLYNKTEGGVKLLVINTLGVLHILEKGDLVTNINDLKGKTLYASGKGSTPEFILNYILKSNGIDPEKDLKIEYKNEHSELMTLAASGMADLVMLPEPFVTTLISKNADFKRKIDLTGAWDEATKKDGKTDSVLAMGGVIVREEFAKSNPKAVSDFLNEYEKSIIYLNNDMESGAELIVKYGIMPEAGLAKAAIPGSNVVFISGTELKTKIANVFDVFFNADPKSVGGKLPKADFYYEG